MEADPTVPGHPSIAIAKHVAMAAVTALLSWISIRYTREPDGVSALWMASGVLTGVLLTSARGLWTGHAIAFLLGNAGARIALGDPWPAALGLSFAALVDALPVALALVVRVGDVTDPARIAKTGRVAFASTLLACAASALIATPFIASSRGMPAGWAYANWFSTHTIGMVLFATLTTVTRSLGWRVFGRPGHRRELALTIVLVGAVCFVVFSQSHYPILFLVFPPLLLSAFRHRLVGAVTSSAMVAASAIAATLSGHGPFQLIPHAAFGQRLLLMQVFIASVCAITFPILTVLTERRVLARNLRENQRRLRAITDNLPAFVMHVDLTGHYTFVNDYTGRMLGFEVDALVGRSVREVTGEVYDQVLPYAEAALRGETVTYELERDYNDRHFHLQSTYIPDRDAAGRIVGYYILSFDITRLKQVERELSLLARHDSLTGLPNRRHFDEQFAQALARQRRSGKPMVVVYLDIDRFKEINDRLGHATGDVVLREFARRLRVGVYDTDFVVRLGGDEFIVLIENVDTTQFIPLIAGKLQAAIAPAIATEHGELFVTSSIGIAFCPKSDCSEDELIKLADSALYQAKAAGRNTWRLVELEASAATP